MKFKKCVKCSEEYPATSDYFYEYNTILSPYCNKCRLAYSREYNKKPRAEMLSKKTDVYALYKGDDLLSIGTLSEIANEMDIKITTVYHYGTPAHKKRVSEDNGRRLVKLEGVE